MLFGFEGKNQARVISISVSNSNLQAAAFCDVVARFYSEPPAGSSFGAFARPAMPIGMALDAPPPDAPMLAAPLARQTRRACRSIAGRTRESQ